MLHSSIVEIVGLVPLLSRECPSTAEVGLAGIASAEPLACVDALPLLLDWVDILTGLGRERMKWLAALKWQGCVWQWLW